jgi:hypothetical protein
VLVLNDPPARLLLDVLITAKDEDSDSDSDVDEDVKQRRQLRAQVGGKPTVWSVIKKNVRPQQLSGAGADWQTLLDDTWREAGLLISSTRPTLDILLLLLLLLASVKHSTSLSSLSCSSSCCSSFSSSSLFLLLLILLLLLLFLLLLLIRASV